MEVCIFSPVHIKPGILHCARARAPPLDVDENVHSRSTCARWLAACQNKVFCVGERELAAGQQTAGSNRPATVIYVREAACVRALVSALTHVRTRRVRTGRARAHAQRDACAFANRVFRMHAPTVISKWTTRRADGRGGRRTESRRKNPFVGASAVKLTHGPRCWWANDEHMQRELQARE